MPSGQSTWLSFVVIVFLSLYSVLNHPSYASESLTVEDKGTEVSEGNWLQRQIRHFRSYPRLDRAYRLVQLKRFAEATKEFEQYLIFHPNDADVRLSYITVLYQLKKYQVVIDVTNQLLEQHPNDYEALKYQAYAYQHLKRFELARERLKQVKNHPLATSEDKTRVFNTLIDLFLTQEKYDLADDLFKKHLVAHPQDSVTTLRYITMLYQQKNYDSVIRVTNQLLKQQPNHYDALKYQAYAYQHLNLFDKAVPLFEKLEAHEQATPEARKFALNSLIDLLLAQKKYAHAIKKMEYYLSAYPNDEAASLRYIVVLHQSGQYSQVISATTQILEKQPEHYTVLKYQAYAYQRVKKNKALLRTLTRLSAHSEASLEERQFFINMRIDQLIAQKQYSQALQAYDNLLEYPKDFKYYYRLGGIYNALQQKQQATSAYRDAYQEASKKSNKFKVLMQLGVLAKKRKDWKKAEEYFLSASSFQSRDLWAIREVANMAYQQKKYGMAIQWIRKALKRQKRVQDQGLLANALYQEKQYGQAIQAYQALLLSRQDKQHDYVLRMRLGYANFHINNVAQAKREFSEAVHLAKSSAQKYDVRMVLGYLDKQDQNWNRAAMHYQAAFDLDSSSITPMWALADIAQAQDDYGTAIAWLDKVLGIDSSPKVKKRLAYAHRAFGLSLYQQQRWELALEQFQQASKMEHNSRVFLYTAFTYKQLGEHVEAEKYIHKALSNPQQLTGVELGMLYRQLGQFHVSVGEYNEALNAFLTSLDYQDDLEARLNIANLYRLTGDINQARQTLEGIDGSTLNSALKLNYFNQFALVYAEQDQYQSAVDVLLKAEALNSTPEQQYQLGLFYSKLGDLKNTSHYLEQANLNQPNNSQYAASLGYLYMAEKRYDTAIKLFQTIVKREPDFPNLYQDLGYAESLNQNNGAAVAWFKKGIDQQASQLNNGLTKQQQKEAQQKIEMMKSEVSKLTNHYQFSFYQMYRSDDDNHKSGVAPSFGNSATPSQGGINVTYQPHKVGYRDGRVLQLFARLLWNTQAQTLQVENDSLQAGIGFRYKPFKEHGLFLGIEKLFEMGENSIDDWLARSQYSWYKTFDADKSTPNHYYLSIYGDLTFFSGRNRGRSFSWEAGIGKKIRVGSNLFVSPHLVANGSYQEPDRYNGSYTEAGAGVSMQALFGGSQYQADTSSAELRLQYKNNIENDYAGWTVTGVLNY